MNQATLKEIRKFLGKSQRELAADLGVSLKAIQSYEQAWRKIPDSVEMQALFYLSRLNDKFNQNIRNCWGIVDCSDEFRSNCMAMKIGSGKECWFVNGTPCVDMQPKRWRDKRKVCFECDAFLQHLQFLKGKSLYKKILSTK